MSNRENDIINENKRDKMLDELKEDSVNFQDADKEAIAETLWKHALKKYHNAHMYIFKEDMLMIINENERQFDIRILLGYSILIIKYERIKVLRVYMHPTEFDGGTAYKV